MKPRWTALFAVAALDVACAVGPDFQRPAAPTDRAYVSNGARETSVADGKAQRFNEGEGVAADWWRLFQCPPLDAVVAQAIAASPALEEARATLRKNEYSLRAGYGVFFPQIDARAGVSRQRYNPAPGTIPGSTYNLFSASGTVTYAVDVWGAGRRQVESLRAAVDAQRYALAAAYLMLTSNVVDAVIAQAAYRAEIDATQATLVLLRDQVRIAKAQATAGTVPYSTVLTLESQVASTEATIPTLEDKSDQANHLIAALSGRTPASFSPPSVALADLHLPEDLPLSLPSELVRQRPDVLIAEAQLHAANANIGVATAAMLPSLTLSAGYGVNATALSDPGGPFWNLGAGLTQPIFHGGALNNQRKAAFEARNASAAQYRQTVLAAFEQVADVLRGLGHDADALKAQTEAVKIAENALHLTQANYSAGIATYLQVLVADIQYVQARNAYIEAVALRLQDTVALYIALGGGWWNAPAATHG